MNAEQNHLAVLASLRRLYEDAVRRKSTLMNGRLCSTSDIAQAYARSFARLHAEIVGERQAQKQSAFTTLRDRITNGPSLAIPAVKRPCPRCGGGTHWRPCACEAPTNDDITRFVRGALCSTCGHPRPCACKGEGGLDRFGPPTPAR
jgi:hypothetical protein